MAQQVLLAVDNDVAIVAAMEHDLSRRFATDYRIVIADSLDAALAKLDADDSVAVAMAGQWLTDTTGVDFLAECHQFHPTAKRLLLITYGDFAAGQAALRAMALGQLDHYVNKPWGNPEVELYPTISERSYSRAQISSTGHWTARPCRRKPVFQAFLRLAMCAMVR